MTSPDSAADVILRAARVVPGGAGRFDAVLRRWSFGFDVPARKFRLRVRQKFKVFGHIGNRAVLVAYASLQHKEVVSVRPQSAVLIRSGAWINASCRATPQVAVCGPQPIIRESRGLFQ